MSTVLALPGVWDRGWERDEVGGGGEDCWVVGWDEVGWCGIRTPHLPEVAYG